MGTPRDPPGAAGRGWEKDAWDIMLGALPLQSEPGRHLKMDEWTDGRLYWWCGHTFKLRDVRTARLIFKPQDALQ